MTDGEITELRSYCRGCGGDRLHRALAEKTITWEEPGTPVYGGDKWEMIQCMGCNTVTFVHSNWFSEETEITDDGPEPIIRRQLYPPAPSRKRPEWGSDFLLGLPMDRFWKSKILDDIYSAIGSGAYGLAAMGLRVLVETTIAEKSGTAGSFRDKLSTLTPTHLTVRESDMIFAAFDMGSAAAHRGFTPNETDAIMLLEITEMVIEKFYVTPVRLARLSNAANTLSANTPPRPPSSK